MNIFTGKPIQGRPRFLSAVDQAENLENVENKVNNNQIKFLTKNELVSKNAPTAFSFFKKIIDWISRQFTFVQRPDAYKARNMWFSSGKDPSNLQLKDLVGHYKKFIDNEKEAPAELKNCLKQFEADIQERNDHQIKLRSLFDEKKKEATNALIEKKLGELKGLKEGETRLFDLNGVACLWSQHQGKYTLQMLGPYRQMAAFQPKTLTLAGKNKIQRSVVFENIPADKLFNIVNDQSKTKAQLWIDGWVGSNSGANEQAAWLKDLAEYHKEALSVDQLKTQDERIDKVYWNVISAIREVITPTKPEFKDQQKQIQLRAQLDGLFDFFRNQRHAFSENSFFSEGTYDELRTMHKNVAANCLRAHRKGQINQSEFEEIRTELDFIADALGKISPAALPLDSKLLLSHPVIPTAKLDMLEAKPILISPKEDQTAALKRVLHVAIAPIAPAMTPMAPVAIQIPTSTPYSQIRTKEEFLRHFRETLALPDQNERNTQFLQFFTEVPFAPFSDINVQDPTSLWWDLNDIEQKEVIEAIYKCATEKFTGDTKKQMTKIRNELSQYQYDAFLKMTWITLFFESKSLKVAFHSHSTRQLEEYLGSQKDELIGRNVHYAYDKERKNVEHSYRKVTKSSSSNAKELINVLKSIDAQNLKAFPKREVLENAFSVKMGQILLKLQDKSEGRPVFHKQEDGYFMSSIFDKWIPNWLPGELKNWMRPINNPFLAALYRNASSFITPVGSGNPILTPESFQTQPQGIFNEIKRVFKALQGEKNSDSLLQNEDISFSEKEQQALLRISKLVDPQTELLSFLKEYPHLFKHASVRNFFDALFFNTSLHRFLKDNHEKDIDSTYLEKTIPGHIQSMIDRLERQLEQGLQDPQSDVKLLNQRFDALAYFYEMKEKLRHVYESHHTEEFRKRSKNDPISTAEFKPSLEAIKRLRQLALTDKRFNGSAASLARLHLNALLAEKDVPAESIPEVIFDYMLVFAGPGNSPNIDPAVDEELKLKWKGIAGALKQNHGQLSMDSIRLTLNYLCYLKGLSPAKDEWKPVAGSALKFNSGDYTVDLETMSVTIESLEKAKGQIELLPEKIVKNPAFIFRFPALAGKSIPMSSQVVNGETIYTFFTADGQPQHITLEDSGNLRCYSEIMVDGQLKVVQELSPSTFPKISLNILEGFRKKSEENGSIFSKFWNVFKLIKVSLALYEKLLPPLFFEQFYLDPSNPSHGYKLNDKNEVLFEVVFKESKEGLEIDYVIDRRSDNRDHWQINTGQDIQELDFFKSIENPEQLIVWSQNNKVKKVELQRYGLTFAWDHEGWKCLNKGLEGYKLEPRAVAKDKKGIEHSLLLRHPDQNKPRKLIIPQNESLIIRRNNLEPKAKSLFGELILAIEFMKQMFNPQGQQEAPLTKMSLVFDDQLSEIKHDILDLRPYSDEICFKEKNPVSNLLNLASHALKTDQPVLALQMIQKIDFKSSSKDQKTLKLMSKFIQDKTLTPAEAALKFKLCCHIFNSLTKQSLSTKPLRKALRKFMLANGKMVLEGGRKIPPQLQLSHNELIQLGVVAKKLDPEFYVQHLQAHLLAKHSVVADAVNQERFGEIKNEWSNIKSELTFDKHIEKLEKLLEGNPLTDADLRAPIARTAPVSLLFDPKDVEFLFKRFQPELPELKLQMKRNVNPAGKNALEAFQQDIDAYRKQELERPQFEIKADQGALKKFSDLKLKPMLQECSHKAAELRNQLYQYMQQSKQADEQLAIYCGEKKMASLDELRQGLTTNSLESMQRAGSIPASADLAQLKNMLTQYFELLSKRHAAAACIKAIGDLEHSQSRNNPVLWKSVSMSLYRMLTIQRHYDPAKDPRPLVFEAQQFLNFRCLDGGLDQLDLLDALMANPTRAIQAPTGAGKTAVISTMRSLLKANGKNLVIQKVTSPLFNQTLDKLKEVLGDLFGRTVYALKFNLSMPMVETIIKKVKDEKGVEKELPVTSSIFKKMYCEMMEVIQSKGCVVTDYKSLPLIEEKFWKLNQDMMELQHSGQPISELQREHFTYLKKILILVNERVDENMDEFDQPNRPINKIQTDLVAGSHAIPPFLTDISIEIYQQLLEDPVLGLRQNVQGDLTEKMRLDCIKRHASQKAVEISQANGLDQDKLIDYFLGNDEDILKVLENQQDFELLDRITLYKDQFSTYLKLTLRGKCKGKYARSDDGSRTIPCYNGVKHDAKPGTIQEQINYTIQDYLQAGITSYDFNLWKEKLKKENQELDPNSPRKQVLQNELQRILPGRTFADLDNPDLLNQHIQQINKDPAKIIEFLKTQLAKLKTSGAVISMGPLDIINMNRVTSGMSATSGAPEALHNNFKMDLKQKGAIRANMALRVCQRAENVEIIYYDPRKPLDLINAAQKNGPLTAIIDGAGVFTEDPGAAVNQLLSSPKIKQVGYHKDGSIVYEGESTGKVENTGFLFTQDQTRGTDIPLAPDARALLTITESDNIGDFFQKEGRLRIETQRFVLAVPKYQKHTKFLQQAISGAICVEADQDGNDIYRKCKQEQQAHLRKEMRKKLFSTNTVEEFLELFKNPEVSKLFITPPAVHYSQAGDYYRAHRHIRQDNCDPAVELEALRKKNVKLAEDLALPEAKNSINGIKYTPELIAKMPEKVPSESAVELEIECEVEVEVEQEVQVEQQLQIEVEAEVENELEKVLGAGDLINFPLRLESNVEHVLAKEVGIPYDGRIHFSDNFLPLSRRNTASLLKRELWDKNMDRVNALRIYFDYDNLKVKKIVIDDSIEKESLLHYTVSGPREGYALSRVIKYDLKTGDITQMNNDLKNISKAMANKELIGAIAQIKFMDGMTNGYSPEEIASLKEWIEQSGKIKMQKHLMDTVLRYRGEDRKDFEGSQLQIEVFN